MTDLNLREASIDDLPKLLELEQKIVDSERPYYRFIKDTDVTYYDIPNLISSASSYLIVMESGAQIIGSGYAQIRTSKAGDTHDRHCYLGFIYLEAEYRGKSLGNEILDSLKEWGINQGAQHFQLDVYSKNESAIRAYEKAGFSQIFTKMEFTV